MSKKHTPKHDEPIEIVEIEQAITSEAPEATAAPTGTSFWFCNGPTLLTLEDGTKYHVRGQRQIETDPDLIAKLKAAADKHRIIIES